MKKQPNQNTTSTGEARAERQAAFSPSEMMLKAAGLTLEEVQWRVRAGLTLAQAIEVTLAEKNLHSGEAVKSA